MKTHTLGSLFDLFQQLLENEDTDPRDVCETVLPQLVEELRAQIHPAHALGITDLVSTYAAELRADGIEPERLDPQTQWPSIIGQLKHCAWMCEQIPTFRDRDKVMKWLGWVQCMFFTTNRRTIGQLASENARAPLAAALKRGATL